MALKIGIIGLPNVGKSTLFNALTKKKVDIANYPFATIEPNVGIVEMPDERLWRISEMSRSKKTISATVEFVDIAGLVKGAAEGEGLGNKFLTHIREVDAIAEVVRVFEDKEIIHVSESPDPLSDIEVVEYELILKDLETVSKRLESVEHEMRGKKKGAEEEVTVLKQAELVLRSGKFIHGVFGGSPQTKVASTKRSLVSCNFLEQLQLLTLKPIIYVFNASERQIQEKWEPGAALKEKIGSAPYVVISAKIESELAELSDEEKREYLNTLEVETSGLDKLIKIGYTTLELMTFFTTGEDETRAWTVSQGSSVPRAGRAIHSDFEEKFIRAEVIDWQKLLEAGSWSKARDLGTLRTEGKEYVVQDGDVVGFKI